MGLNRREVLGSGLLLGAGLAGWPDRARAAPTRPKASPVSLRRCRSYDLSEVTRELSRALDDVGGLRRLVAGKTVTLKPNLTGDARQKAAGLPAGRSFQVHPGVVLAAVRLLDAAGARRIRIVDCTYQTAPLSDLLRGAGWDLGAFASARAAVDFEDTRNLGQGRRYHRVKVPWGGSLFPAYELNHAYVECDVFVSLAKLKNHVTAGVTLTLKNNFGVTPTSLYGGPVPDEKTTANRVAILHDGSARPPAGVPQELDPASPRSPPYRVARHTVDAVGIRPIDLAIIDGIETVSGGEGPWHKGLQARQPGLLIAGLNPVCTDAIATRVMGYDPLAAAGTGPFPGDNHLTLAMGLGLGSARTSEIEVRGLGLAQALHPFGWQPRPGG